MAMPDGSKFDSATYWEQRLSSHRDITGVGFLGRSSRLNELQYRQRIRQLDRGLHSHGLANVSGRSVLDVGAGTGIWLDFWHKHDASYVTGLDFTQTSVDMLRVRFPKDQIVRADLTVKPLPLPDDARFDIISAIDVLHHIVDPAGFSQAIANLAQHCVLGGWLITSEPVVEGRGFVRPRLRTEHDTVRTLDEYRDVLETNGFVIDAIYPATILLNNPLEAPNRLIYRALSIWWKASKSWERSDLLVRLGGPTLLWTDQILCRICTGHTTPTAKLIFARKQSLDTTPSNK
jgi:2-polyprenyl-3-methyl-5-hydroxy-6-metoxy-1,4-benzoquinol methylase